MKAVKVTLMGKERALLFNGAAMFAPNEEFGTTTKLMEQIGEQDAEGFRAICKTAAVLMEQAELAKRYYGYEPEEIMTEENISLLSPMEIMPLKVAITRTIVLGFGREIDAEDEKIDLYLVEINQKNETMKRAHYYQMASTCGIGIKECLILEPGTVFDMFELYVQAHGGRKKED